MRCLAASKNFLSAPFDFSINDARVVSSYSVSPTLILLIKMRGSQKAIGKPRYKKLEMADFNSLNLDEELGIETKNNLSEKMMDGHQSPEEHVEDNVPLI